MKAGTQPAPGMGAVQPAGGDALAEALHALAEGDTTVRLDSEASGTRLARAFNRVAERTGRTDELIERYESIMRELKTRQEELRQANDRLEIQTENLKQSELVLKRQQARLRAANEELEGKAQLLSQRMAQVELKNREVEQAKAAVEERAEQLALSSRYKSEFLANMSHELRTPLNSMLILAKLLADNAGSNLSTRQVEYARTILAAGTDLLSLINDILDLAKVESGTMTLNVGGERFSDLCEYFEASFRQVAADKGLQFQVVVAQGLPDSMETDSKRLRQILRNLLSNAFKFTAQGQVTLSIAPAEPDVLPGDGARPAVAFSVVDTGIGIPEDKHAIIFEEFQQADGATSRQYGGTGLGLSISRELAHLLGGEIRVKSAPGKGSTFALYVPLHHEWWSGREPVLGVSVGGTRADADGAPGEGTAPEPPVFKPDEEMVTLMPRKDEPGAADAAGLSGRKALIIDDDIRNIFALSAALEHYGMQVVFAERARQGFELLKQNPDTAVALVDIMMPEIDGYDAIRIIRGMEGFRDLPIIALTAKAMKGDREKCIEAGASDYLAKPVRIEQLLSLLQVWTAKSTH